MNLSVTTVWPPNSQYGSPPCHHSAMNGGSSEWWSTISWGSPSCHGASGWDAGACPGSAPATSSGASSSITTDIKLCQIGVIFSLSQELTLFSPRLGAACVWTYTQTLVPSVWG
eukprot:RCo045975